MSLAISQWHTWLPYLYSWLHMLYTLFKTFRPIYLHGRSYSFVALILWTRECPTMSSNSQTSRSHKSKNPRGHDKNSCWVTLTPWIASKRQFLKTLSAPSRQKRKPPSLSNCDNLQRLTLQRTPIKHSVKHESKKKINIRMRLMMTSVPFLNNFSSLHIMVWKKIYSIRTKMSL